MLWYNLIHLRHHPVNFLCGSSIVMHLVGCLLVSYDINAMGFFYALIMRINREPFRPSALSATIFTYYKDFIMSVERVLITIETKVTMHELREQQGDLMFHQRGCCDGSLPMCYKDDQFKVGRSDVK